MKQTIIILHGWGLSGEAFSVLGRELSNLGFEVYLPDLPGFGTSSPPDEALTLDDYVEFLHTYICAKTIHKPIIIGHSFGGRVALKYVFSYKNECKLLILTGVPGYRSGVIGKRYVFMMIAKLGKLAFSLPVLSAFTEEIRKKYYHAIGVREFNKSNGNMKQTFKNVVDEPLDSYMKGINIPSYLVWGSHDSMVPVFVAKHMQQTIPNSHLIVVSNAGHSFPYKEPAHFVQAIKHILLPS
jgi:pimeloyl-ACP methyl ester carboxylesterase